MYSLVTSALKFIRIFIYCFGFIFIFAASTSTMVRQFKYHEQKLLKKVDFLNVRPIHNILPTQPTHTTQWKQDANLREIKVMRRYHIQDRDDYHK